jgi:hypothetical protein
LDDERIAADDVDLHIRDVKGSRRVERLAPGRERARYLAHS